jgi:xanthine dehydrogenase FAD-binding subunit
MGEAPVVEPSITWIGVDLLSVDRRKVPPSCAPPDPMAHWKHYFIPQSIQSALEVLQQAPGTSRLIAGGTDLLLEIQQGHHPPVDNLVDVNQIPEMQRLELEGDELVIGAAVSLKKITQSEVILQHAAALHDASGLVGGPQVRNTATLGGNVSHALPAADGMISLMALQPNVKIVGPQGERRVDLQTIFKGPGQSTLTPFEIVTEFRLPLRKGGESSAFSRVMRPQGVALPILNLGLWLARDGDTIRGCRIAVGPAGPVPMLCTNAAQKMVGRKPSDQLIEEIGQAILDQVKYRTSPRRATAEYRKHITTGLLEEVFRSAWIRSENY